jgi:rod shape-determining protein MreC
VQRGIEKRFRALALIAVFICVLSLIYATGDERVKVSKLEETVTEALAPATKLFYRTSSALASVWRQTVLWSRLDGENRAYKKRIQQLEAQLGQLDEYRLENQRLRTLLNFQEKNKNQMTLEAAQVVGRNPVNWMSTITIDKGAGSGIKKDQAVITAGGVVGIVRSATENTANVLLLSDARLAIGGIVRTNRHLVLLEGKADKPGYCTVRGLTADVRLKKGDQIISSGLGGIFPKGLPLGAITQVQRGKYGLGFQGLLRPAVDLSKLEEVFVVKNFHTPPVDEESQSGERQ